MSRRRRCQWFSTLRDERASEGKWNSLHAAGMVDETMANDRYVETSTARPSPSVPMRPFYEMTEPTEARGFRRWPGHDSPPVDPRPPPRRSKPGGRPGGSTPTAPCPARPGTPAGPGHARPVADEPPALAVPRRPRPAEPPEAPGLHLRRVEDHRGPRRPDRPGLPPPRPDRPGRGGRPDARARGDLARGRRRGSGPPRPGWERGDGPALRATRAAMLAAATLMIAAESLGVASAWLEGFDEEKVREALRHPRRPRPLRPARPRLRRRSRPLPRPVRARPRLLRRALRPTLAARTSRGLIYRSWAGLPADAARVGRRTASLPYDDENRMRPTPRPTGRSWHRRAWPSAQRRSTSSPPPANPAVAPVPRPGAWLKQHEAFVSTRQAGGCRPPVPRRLDHRRLGQTAAGDLGAATTPRARRPTSGSAATAPSTSSGGSTTASSTGSSPGSSS